MALVEDTESILNASQIENNFKIAQVLQIRKETEKSIRKYQDICFSLEKIIFNNPNSNVEIHYIPLSLSKLSDIYKEKEDFNKALLFMTCSRKFLEYIANERSRHSSEKTFNEEGGEENFQPLYEEHSLNELFQMMHSAFEAPDSLPPKDPQEIISEFLSAKKRQEEEVVLSNLAKVKRINEERKLRLANSRFERFVEWVNGHSVIVVFIIFLIFIVFLSLSFLYMSHSNNSIRKIIDHNRQNPSQSNRFDLHINGKNDKHHHNRKFSHDDIKQFREKFRKLNEERRSARDATEL